MKRIHFKLILLFVFLIDEAYAQNKNSLVPVGYSAEAIRWIKIIDLNPENLDAHEKFKANVSAEKLMTKYQYWIKRFPKSPTVYYAIGEYLYQNMHFMQSQYYLAKSVQLNPKQSNVWSMMAKNAESYSDKWENNYALRAVALDSLNARYNYQVAFSYRKSDPAKRDSLMMNILNQFPGTAESMMALSNLIVSTPDRLKKEQYYKLLLSNRPNKRSPLYNSLMINYYYFRLLASPRQAGEFALTMSRDKDALFLNDWRNLNKTAEKLERANQMLAAQKPDSALLIIDSLRIGRGNDDLYTHLLLLKAKATDAAAGTKKAYQILINEYSRLPTDTLKKVAAQYAAKLNIDENMMMNNIWTIRDAHTVRATDFRLKNFLSKDSISLKDYRGKVVLLTYWFPGCKPCLEEFPYLEAAIKKVNSSMLVYLGLSIWPPQNSEVLPLVRANGYSFIPLKDDDKRDKGNLQVLGAPHNYIIDQSGNVVFSDFRIDSTNGRSLELMLTELLNRKNRQAAVLPEDRRDTAANLRFKY